MKLTSLLSEIEANDQNNPELVAIPFFREFQSKYGFAPLFKYIGVKGGEMVFTATIPDLGGLNLVIKEAQLIAKVEQKQAMFGIVCTTTGLDKVEYPVCKIKLKGDQAECICYDSKDKTNFSAAVVRFMDTLK